MYPDLMYPRRVLWERKFAHLHCRQLMADWQAGRLGAACLNNLLQSAWRVQNPPRRGEKAQAYLQRQVAGARRLQSMMDQPLHNLALARLLLRCKLSLSALRHLRRIHPDTLKLSLQRHGAVHAGENAPRPAAGRVAHQAEAQPKCALAA